MEDGFWETIERDLTGAGQLRLVLQPLLALVLGIRLGAADARAGAEPFLFRLFMRPGRRRLLRASLHDLVVPLLLAFTIDAILQVITLGRFRPLAAVVVGALLVWLPFVVARALTNRLWTATRRGPRPVH